MTIPTPGGPSSFPESVATAGRGITRGAAPAVPDERRPVTGLLGAAGAASGLPGPSRPPDATGANVAAQEGVEVAVHEATRRVVVRLPRSALADVVLSGGFTLTEREAEGLARTLRNAAAIARRRGAI